MKILLTNDDGFIADGMQELARSLRAEHDVWVVAPDGGRSCCSHGVTNTRQIRVRKVEEDGWEVDGTPADCVRTALHSLDLKPELVISGVNHGGNLGIDTLFSGTVAAAREASIAGLRAIAISQYMRRDIACDWSQTAFRAHKVLEQVWARHSPQGLFWNINLPVIGPEERVGTTPFPLVDCRLEPSPLAYEFRLAPGDQRGTEDTPSLVAVYDYVSNYQERPRSDGFDVALCFAGHTTVTQLKAFPFA